MIGSLVKFINKNSDLSMLSSSVQQNVQRTSLARSRLAKVFRPITPSFEKCAFAVDPSLVSVRPLPFDELVQWQYHGAEHPVQCPKIALD
jgi:hypothetical protein